MAGDRITLQGAHGAQIRIEGLRATLRALQSSGADMSAMPDVMHALGMLVADTARPRVPRLSGRMVGTLRAGRGKTKAVIRMGGARVPYAGVIHYGWPARGIRAQPVLAQAHAEAMPRVLAHLDDALTDILRDNNLDTD